MSSAEVRVREAERSHADILHQLRKLEQRLTEAAEGERREEDLLRVVEDQDKELRQLREQVSRCCHVRCMSPTNASPVFLHCLLSSPLSTSQCISVEEQALTLQSEVQASGEKEEHWRSEIARLSQELELSQQRLVQLESELARSEEEMEDLQGKLRSSQRMQDLAREEVGLVGGKGWGWWGGGALKASCRVQECNINT